MLSCICATRAAAVAMLLGDLTLAAAMSLLLAVHARVSKAFHHNFNMFFRAFILAYISTELTPVLIYVFTIQMNAYEEFESVILMWLRRPADTTYTAISFIALLTVMERIVATVRRGSYERTRPLPPAAIGLATIASAILSIVYTATVLFFDWQTLDSSILLGLSCLEFLSMFTLFYLNRRMVSVHVAGRLSLSSRYQLNENVRTLRVVLTTLTLDALVTSIDFIGREFVVVRFYQLPEEDCREQRIASFAIIRVLSFLAELAIPLSLLLGHPSYRSCLLTPLRRWLARNAARTRHSISAMSESSATTELRLRNVLGATIKTSSSPEEHFQIRSSNNSNYSVSTVFGLIQIGYDQEITNTRVKGPPKADKLVVQYADVPQTCRDPTEPFKKDGTVVGEITGETVIKLSAAE